MSSKDHDLIIGQIHQAINKLGGSAQPATPDGAQRALRDLGAESKTASVIGLDAWITPTRCSESDETESEEGHCSWLRDARHDSRDSSQPVAVDDSKGVGRCQFDRTGDNADTHGKLSVDEFGKRVNKAETDRIWTDDGYTEKE